MGQPTPNRRRFLKRAAWCLAGAGLAAYGYAWRIEPHWVEYVERDLPVRGLPAALEGRSLVQLSDLHVGPEVDSDYLIEHFRRVQDRKPDVVVMTGDFMTCAGDEQLARTARVLEHLPRGTLATAAILGNHDYGETYTRADVADRLARDTESQGVRVLRNETLDVRGLTLVGVEDMWGPCFEDAEVLEKLDPSRPNLVLCHNPDAADHPVWHGYRGWILCGHTHGGQCKIPGFRPPLLPVSNKRYVAGEYDLFDGRRMYINRGLGHLRRVRFNVRPEVTLFTLRREQAV
jgi:predicted MPP superfamily phosphohydrolase